MQSLHNIYKKNCCNTKKSLVCIVCTHLEMLQTHSNKHTICDFMFEAEFDFLILKNHLVGCLRLHCLPVAMSHMPASWKNI